MLLETPWNLPSGIEANFAVSSCCTIMFSVPVGPSKSVCVYEREREERERECVCERKRERGCVREREMEKESE